MKKRTKRAFTLIELLIVIAIIGILTGLLTTAVMVAKGRAKRVRAQAEVRELIRAWNAYYITYGKFPAGLENAINAPMDAGNISYLLENNPHHRRLLNGKIDVGTDGFRDPWGNYYIVDFKSSSSSKNMKYTAAVALPQVKRYIYDN